MEQYRTVVALPRRDGRTVRIGHGRGIGGPAASHPKPLPADAPRRARRSAGSARLRRAPPWRPHPIPRPARRREEGDPVLFTPHQHRRSCQEPRRVAVLLWFPPLPRSTAAEPPRRGTVSRGPWTPARRASTPPQWGQSCPPSVAAAEAVRYDAGRAVGHGGTVQQQSNTGPHVSIGTRTLLGSRPRPATAVHTLTHPAAAHHTHGAWLVVRSH